MRFLLASSDDATLGAARESLSSRHELVLAGNRLSAMEEVKAGRFDICFFDLEFLRSPQFSQSGMMDEIKSHQPESKFVLLTGADTVREVVDLVKASADNYLTYPIDPIEMDLVIEKILRQERRLAELNYLRDQFWDPDSLELVKTSSESMVQVFEKVRDVAPTRSTVHLSGETGVGKGVLARLIHRHSSRRDKQFIHVHCGAISEGLVESELFGHEQGAFTGAVKRKMGKFELADKGTIFLDEVSTLSASAQIKLLQVLQDGVFQRVGGEADIHVDVRVVAATNENLEELVEEGTFRRDLFFRLNVFPINIPPLRERVEDIPALLASMLARLQKSYLKNISGFQSELIGALQKYSWPGNIRELENLVERAYIIEKSNLITTESFPNELFENNQDQALLPLNLDLPLSEARHRMVENFERQYLAELLATTGGKISVAADRAQIGVRQLNKLMNKYGLRKEDFRC